jgi:UDP-N-acetyl-D-mannosaminuronic acid dehydrogenase
MNKRFGNSISVIGGAGHVGLPLAALLSSKIFFVTAIDKNVEQINFIKKGNNPFLEDNLPKILKKNLKKGRIKFSEKLDEIKNTKYIIVCVGTPITNKLKPNLKNFFNLLKNIKDKVNHSHHIIIRSSIPPGTFKKIKKYFNESVKISYCPERIAQGKSIIEMPNIPQIISAYSKNEAQDAKAVFKEICKEILICTPEEAEMAKILSNAYRYLTFSISNEFYYLCESLNLNFEKIRRIMVKNYSRNQNLAKAGFVGGPCLMKDTMQLASIFKKRNGLLKSSYHINEGMPKFLISKIKKIKNYRKCGVLLLGLTFKPNNDDLRGSLSLKLFKLLKKNRIKNYFYDNFVIKKDISELSNYIKNCKIIIVGTEHTFFKKVKIPKNKIMIDISGFFLN